MQRHFHALSFFLIASGAYIPPLCGLFGVARANILLSVDHMILKSPDKYFSATVF